MRTKMFLGLILTVAVVVGTAFAYSTSVSSPPEVAGTPAAFTPVAVSESCCVTGDCCCPLAGECCDPALRAAALAAPKAVKKGPGCCVTGECCCPGRGNCCAAVKAEAGCCSAKKQGCCGK